MPRPGERVPDPSRTLCPDCAWEIPPPAAMTKLHVAQHAVVHGEWVWRHRPAVARGRLAQAVDLLEAYRAHAAQLEDANRRLRHERNDAVDTIRTLTDELGAITDQLADAITEGPTP